MKKLVVAVGLAAAFAVPGFAMGLLAKAFAERNPQPKVTGTSFAVAARRGNVVWLSEYLLMPFVWSEDTTLDWNAMRLDSFAAEILMDAMK